MGMEHWWNDIDVTMGMCGQM